MTVEIFEEMAKDIIVFDISTEGTEPLKGRILGTTLKNEKEEKIFTNRNEKIMLEEFWDYVGVGLYLEKKLVGFNSDNFDIPFLIIRSIKNKVAIPDLRGRLIDVRKIIFRGDRHQKGTLDDFRELLGLPPPDSRYKKMHFSLLWGSDNLPNLKEFLLGDVRLTWQLYKIVSEAGLVR